MQNILIVLLGKVTNQLDEFFVIVIRDCSVIGELLPAARGKVRVRGRLPELFSDLKRVYSYLNVKHCAAL
jgi:hypothetical protein